MKWLGKINCIVGGIGFFFVIFYDKILGRPTIDIGRWQILAIIFCVLLFFQGLMMQERI